MKDYVKVTTDFGPDLIFATVMIENGQATVKDWHMDGRRMDVSELSSEQYQLLCSLAEENPRTRKVKYTVLGIFGEDNTRGVSGQLRYSGRSEGKGRVVPRNNRHLWIRRCDRREDHEGDSLEPFQELNPIYIILCV